MEAKAKVPKTTNDCVARRPGDVQPILQTIRATIYAAAPGANETIRYQMPAFRLKGNLVHLAAFNGHIGFYPSSSGVDKCFQVGAGLGAVPRRSAHALPLHSQDRRFPHEGEPRESRRQGGEGARTSRRA